MFQSGDRETITCELRQPLAFLSAQVVDQTNVVFHVLLPSHDSVFPNLEAYLSRGIIDETSEPRRETATGLGRC